MNGATPPPESADYTARDQIKRIVSLLERLADVISRLERITFDRLEKLEAMVKRPED